jgi:glycerate-2-kinase
MAILNRTRLLDHGPAALRRHALEIVEAAIRSADPYTAAKQRLQRQEKTLQGDPLLRDTLQVDGRPYDLASYRHVYVLGAGKATRAIAQALEELLGDRIDDGVVVLKHGEAGHLQRIRTVYAGHPVPDAGSLRGGEELLDLARRAGEGDLVISAVTGGSSALAVAPAEGISLADKQAVNELLLACGGTIFEINAVRKHISRIKGGRLALEVFPAELLCLTVSDVVGDSLDFITDLTVPDTSTYQDAWRTLDKYALWDRLPVTVRRHLEQGPETETPKAFPGRWHPVLLVAGDAAYQGALQRCRELGYRTAGFSRQVEGEASQEALALVQAAGQPDLPGLASTSRGSAGQPFALVATGEAVVTIDGPAVPASKGAGGPNQELALSAALAIQGRPSVVLAAVDADGIDGPTEAAGALVDGETVARARQAGLDPAEHLRTHRAYPLLAAAGDLIVTGPTGTNVNDLMIVLRVNLSTD